MTRGVRSRNLNTGNLNDGLIRKGLKKLDLTFDERAPINSYDPALGGIGSTSMSRSRRSPLTRASILFQARNLPLGI